MRRRRTRCRTGPSKCKWRFRSAGPGEWLQLVLPILQEYDIYNTLKIHIISDGGASFVFLILSMTSLPLQNDQWWGSSGYKSTLLDGAHLWSVAISSWLDCGHILESFMLTTGPNMGTTKTNIQTGFLLKIFNTRNYILNRILDGHFRGDTKQEKLLSFLWITRDSSLIQLIWRKVRTN